MRRHALVACVGLLLVASPVAAKEASVERHRLEDRVRRVPFEAPPVEAIEVPSLDGLMVRSRIVLGLESVGLDYRVEGVAHFHGFVVEGPGARTPRPTMTFGRSLIPHPIFPEDPEPWDGYRYERWRERSASDETIALRRR